MNLHIAFFTDTYWPRVNGVTVSVDVYSRALIRAGHKVVIVCPRYPPSFGSTSMSQSRDDEPAVIMVPSVPVVFSKEDRLAMYHKLRWVRRQLDRFKPDILHINTEFVTAEFALRYARRRALPLIYTAHTHWEAYTASYIPMFPVFIQQFIVRGILERLLRNVDAVIVPTPEAETIIARYNVHDKVRCLPTGIDPKIFIRSKSETAGFRQLLEERFPVLCGKRILLYAGRITKEKNIDFILKVFETLTHRHSDIVLIIAGDGHAKESLRNKARQYGIEELCVWLGYMNQRDLALLYAAASVFMLSSLTETQGLVTIEAMSMGTPVVAVASMGTKFAMAGDNGGFLTECSVEAFGEKVCALLEDDALMRRKRIEARNNARRWFIDSMISKLTSIYKDAVIHKRMRMLNQVSRAPPQNRNYRCKHEAR